MLVYGDRSRTVDPRRVLAGLAGVTGTAPPDVLRRALITAGELAQGLADSEFEARGQDDLTKVQAAAMSLATAAARRMIAAVDGPGAYERAIAALGGLPLPRQVRCKIPEGYAFYAVYPEAYAAAATAHRWFAPPLAIGLRSIGASLAATVAAATGGEAISLRPTGPPFQRRLELSERLRHRLAGHDGPFAIVDEGPGLSGSSFGCVADLLTELGVAEDRIAFMPSHPGDPGAEASTAHRARWARATRLVRTFEDLSSALPLSTTFEPEIGVVQSAEDLSGGAWRRAWPAGARPPATPALERLKFRFHVPDGSYLARFVGLGEEGQGKFERAQALSEAGFGPEPIALRRGFLLERWLQGAALASADDRPAFLHRLGDYLALRDTAFLAKHEEGADGQTLRDMAVHNTAALCGETIAQQLRSLISQVGDGTRRRPVHVDARLHPWEWRVTAAGLRKLDGLDHSCAHDLVGAQDVLWDVAGAAVEFDLTADETDALARRVGRDPQDVRPLTACYAAFQGGLWSMAGEAEGDGQRAVRHQIERYRERLIGLASPL